jgi:beta-lactam-binding protein with PASTA domain
MEIPVTAWRKLAALMVLALAAAPLWAVIAPRPPASAPRATVVDPRFIALPRERFNPPAAALVQYVVPDVVNQPLAQAVATLNQQGFKTAAQSADGSTTGERVVVSTRPAAGARGPITQKPLVTVLHRAAPVAPPRTVPSITGATCSEAARVLSRLDLKLVFCEAGAATGQQRSGLIHTQRPQAGAPISEDRSVRAWVEPVAAPTLTMPDIVNKSCDDAATALARLNLRLVTCQIGAATARVSPGRIHTQTPLPGAQLPADRQVRAVVEPQPDTRVTVPDVRERTAIDAQRVLRDAQLEPVGVAPAQNNPWHVVRNQKPRAPTRADRGSRVQLELEGRFVVPALQGLSCEAAQSAARQRGFAQVSCRDEDSGAASGEGRVFSQSVEANTVLAAPQALQVSVHRPAPVVVPDVTGQPIAQARERIRQAQLTARVSGPQAAQGMRVGTQEPPGGSAAARGSAVALTTLLTVPDLEALNCADANARARAHGFSRLRCEEGTQEGPSDTGALRTGAVFSQKPTAGQSLAAPTPLVAYLVAPALVPDVQGQPLPAAQQAIAQAGLRALADDSAAGVDAADREVTGQSLAPGTRVDRGSEVRLQTVALVTVPELTGRACDEAQRELAARSLTLNCAVVNAGRFTWTAPLVESQDVAPGARVRAGHRINAQARAPLPWLALVLGGSSTLVLGALAYKPIVARLRLGPKATAPPPVPAPPLGLRGEPDATPTIALRLPDESTVGASPLGLRVERGNERLFVRGLEKSDGFDDGGQDGTSHD